MERSRKISRVTDCRPIAAYTSFCFFKQPDLVLLVHGRIGHEFLPKGCVEVEVLVQQLVGRHAADTAVQFDGPIVDALADHVARKRAFQDGENPGGPTLYPIPRGFDLSRCGAARKWSLVDNCAH